MATRGNPAHEHLRAEASLAILYFAGYLGYLFHTQETESRHWLTLVAIPLAFVGILYQRWYRTWDAGPVLASFGLRRGQLGRGIPVAALLGLGFTALQFVLSRAARSAVPILLSTRSLVLIPTALLLTLTTAGFTEEFFFRGFLLTRIRRATSSAPLAIVVTALLFGVYHLPYALLNPCVAVAWEPRAGRRCSVRPRAADRTRPRCRIHSQFREPPGADPRSRSHRSGAGVGAAGDTSGLTRRHCTPIRRFNTGSR